MTSSQIQGRGPGTEIYGRNVAPRKNDRVQQDQRNWLKVSLLWVPYGVRQWPVWHSWTSAPFWRKSSESHESITFLSAMNRMFPGNSGFLVFQKEISSLYIAVNGSRYTPSTWSMAVHNVTVFITCSFTLIYISFNWSLRLVRMHLIRSKGLGVFGF